MVMPKNRRKGNMLIIVVLMFLVLILLSGALTLAKNGKNSAKSKATTLTDLNTALVFSNVVASYMKESIESAGITKNTGIDTEMDIGMYDDALAVINSRVFIYDAPTNTRTFGNGSTSEVMQYIYYESTDAEQNAVTLSEKSTYTIKVSEPLTLDYGEQDNIINLASGDSIALRDIYFTLELRYGGRLIKQEYCLENEKASFTVAEGFFNLSIDGSESRMKLLSQSISY